MTLIFTPYTPIINRSKSSKESPSDEENIANYWIQTGSYLYSAIDMVEEGKL